MKEYVYATDEHEGHWLTGDEIVRCGDCVYYDVTGEKHRLYSDKVYCEKLWKYVEPNGFCAWGERRRKKINA